MPLAGWGLAAALICSCSRFGGAQGGDGALEADPQRGLPFLECEGPGFHPAWLEFKSRLGTKLIQRGSHMGDELANAAADLLDEVESQDFGAAVAAFGARLRGDQEAEQALGGFCLFGAMAAYAVVAVHLDNGLGSQHDVHLEPTAKSSVARALLLLAKKQVNDFLESTSWPLRSLDLVALLESEDAGKIRELGASFHLPCHMQLGCSRTLQWAEDAVVPPLPPLAANWPSEVAAVGIHTTSTMEAVSALRDATAEAWGRGGAASSPFNLRFAGHPCPSHSGSQHQCNMRCELLGVCDSGADASDPLADFIAGIVDAQRFAEREAYSMAEARAAFRWVPAKLSPIAKVDLIICTFPTVLCVLLHEFFPALPLLFVAIANPLFGAPGCRRREDTTVSECESAEAQEYLRALRAMLSGPRHIRGLAAYTITAALVGYQVGIGLPLAGKAGRYLPPDAMWRFERPAEVLIARSRILETSFGPSFRTVFAELASLHGLPLACVFQQDEGSYLSFQQLSAFRAVVIFAQDLGLHKFTEHYAMSMPIWMPSKAWAYRLQMLIPWGMVSYSGSLPHREEEGDEGLDTLQGEPSSLVPPSEDWPKPGSQGLAFQPFFNAQSVPYPLPKVAFWYEFSEFVSYPGVQSFESVPALLSGLAGADLFVIAGQMRRFRAELWRTTRAVYAAVASDIAAGLAEALRDGGRSPE